MKNRGDNRRGGRRAAILPLAALCLWLAAGGGARAFGIPGVCSVPQSLDYNDVGLPAVAAKLKAGETVQIVAIGSASSAKTGRMLTERAYPERLVDDLAKRFPGAHFALTNLSSKGQLASAMVERFPLEVFPLHPALVIWQTGTVESVQGLDLDAFGDTLATGLAELRTHGIDVILMNMQYSPYTAALLNPGPYREAMLWAARAQSVMLFDRYAIMRYWQETGVVDFASPSTADQAKYDDIVHGCIAELLGDMITAGVNLSREETDKP